MPDADRLDRLLAEAGERWRATQPPAPFLDAVWQAPASRPRWRETSLLVAAALVVLLAAAAINIGGSPRPSPAAVLPSPSPTVRSSCPATLRSDVGPLASQVATLSLPGSLVPYGLPDLWATIPRSGFLGSSPSTSGGRFLRTFWYSDRWSITDEPSPALSVAAGRLGGGESVIGSAAVGAHSRELGDSMIVSLDLPSGGCWQITGTYRDQSLSYVVLVQPEGPAAERSPIPSPPAGPDLTPWPGYELPRNLDGMPVLVGDDALAAFEGSTDSTSLLVGGFVRGGEVRFCPADLGSDPFFVCDGVFLYARPFDGPDPMVLYRGSGPVMSLPEIPTGSMLPVVFLVHTHDSACVAPRTDCVLLPVADQLRWAGPVGPIPSPTSTQPPNGLSQSAAEATAVQAANAVGRAVTVVSARSGHYAEVGPPGSMDVDADRWVWAVVVQTIQVAPSCPSGAFCPAFGSTTLVVVDFVTGEVLIQETPAPSS